MTKEQLQKITDNAVAIATKSWKKNIKEESEQLSNADKRGIQRIATTLIEIAGFNSVLNVSAALLEE